MNEKRTASQIGKSNVRRGKTLERRVAHLLTDWTGRQFRRRRVEGRLEDVVALERTGDVIPSAQDDAVIFNIEVKCGSGFSLDSLFAKPNQALFTQWFHQSSYDSMIATKQLRLGGVNLEILPMVFFKPNPQTDWIAFSAKAISHIGALSFPHLYFDWYRQIGPVAANVSHGSKNKVLVSVDLDDCVFCRWSDFSSSVSPEKIFIKNLV